MDAVWSRAHVLSWCAWTKWFLHGSVRYGRIIINSYFLAGEEQTLSSFIHYIPFLASAGLMNTDLWWRDLSQPQSQTAYHAKDRVSYPPNKIITPYYRPVLCHNAPHWVSDYPGIDSLYLRGVWWAREYKSCTVFSLGGSVTYLTALKKSFFLKKSLEPNCHGCHTHSPQKWCNEFANSWLHETLLLWPVWTKCKTNQILHPVSQSVNQSVSVSQSLGSDRITISLSLLVVNWWLSNNSHVVVYCLLSLGPHQHHLQPSDCLPNYNRFQLSPSSIKVRHNNRLRTTIRSATYHFSVFEKIPEDFYSAVENPFVTWQSSWWN